MSKRGKGPAAKNRPPAPPVTHGVTKRKLAETTIRQHPGKEERRG
jgi:hypothetical protein